MQKIVRRTPAEKEEDRIRIKELLMKGVKAKEIATKLNIPYDVVVSDIQVISFRIGTSVVNADAVRNEQLEKLNLMERELWEAWEKSKVVERKTTSNSMTARGNRTEEIVEEGSGDTKIMDQILRIIQERNKLLGIYAAVKTEAKVEVNHNNNSAEIKNQVLEMIEQARLRALRNQSTITDTTEVVEGKLIGPGDEDS